MLRLRSEGATGGDSGEKFLPFSAPWVGPEEKDEVLRALDSDWITTGPRARAFEEAFQEYIGSREAVGVSSCTAALHLALRALDVGPGDAVFTTPFTFAATANAVVYCQADPIFIDIRPDTYNLDPERVEEFIIQHCTWEAGEKRLTIGRTGKQVRAIIAVHYAGQPCDMDAIGGIARRYGLKVIEDAAHALGATYKGKKAGVLGDVACFSFYPTKNITTGEGGMLTTNDSALAQRVRLLSLHGISRDAWKRYGREGSWQYDLEEVGFKYNLTDLAAALGLHQLRKLPRFRERRAELAAQYDQLLAELPLQLPVAVPDTTSAWHLYPVQILADPITRDDLIEKLRRRN
ncbi:MAG: DegT/DnrJ/EryC1/StrS family aminotransferase, partial [Terriglobia bacterium]